MRFVLLFVLAFGALRPLPAFGADLCADPSHPTGFALPATEAARRIAFVEETLAARDGYAKLWKYGWISVFGVGALGQLGIGLLTDDQKVKNDAYVGAATAFLGVSGMVISPVDYGGNLETLRTYPGEGTGATFAKLSCAEWLLKDTAAGETYGRGWQEYVLSTLVSGTAGAIMWLYFDQPESFWLKAGSGVVFSQLRIHTTPREATRAWETYRRDYGVVTPGLAAAKPGFDVVLTPVSAQLAYRF